MFFLIKVSLYDYNINGDYVKFKKFLILLFITFIVPLVPSIIVGNDVQGLLLPKLYPPSILFPIVWSIIYLLNTIGIYLVTLNDDDAYVIYFIQLLVNSLWTILFFGLKFRLLAFILLVILLILVVVMSIKFYKKNKIAGYLQIPYIVWLLFAGYLNFAIYLFNH